MDAHDPLDSFLPPVRQWFREALGEPTLVQRRGWPAIASGQNTLLLAPTGSGKTLAAFLACLDHLWRQESLSPGVRVLYISPLKALNNDIHRNLQLPLEGVVEQARRMGQPLPVLASAVRTGDTPSAERQRLIRRPPPILITTPESLHLLLTSRARETLRTVSHCIVDEIHALCPNKRGVFLALLLERLEALQPPGKPLVRIGLSATQRPLEEVARYLGGATWEGDRFRERPVTIVDAGLRKDLDLQVINPIEQFGPIPEGSVWPSIYRLLYDLIHEHRSTLVFANNRRSVERMTACINEIHSGGEEPDLSLLHTLAGRMLPSPAELARAHHGSVALEVRQEIECALKEGRLSAVIATASLELGIDMGAVDLVCQVESPGNVARALQRVGRAGHLVGQTSKGRLIPKTSADLLEQAVLTREMARGNVEAVRVPMNCLDVLAQQVVAMVAMEDWNTEDLFALVRRAYPFRDLSPQAFEATLEMVTGRFRNPQSTIRNPQSNGTTLTALQPRISWDRVHNLLRALPGSQQLALTSGGTIPDTGQYAAYSSTGVRIGELDEEFIYERRLGDTFLLGTTAWRLERIDADRVIVSPAEGAPAMVPFWRGEGVGRSYELGQAIGAFLRELEERLDQPNRLDWLQHEHFLDARAARSLCHHVTRQLLVSGTLPTDRTLYIEASRDQLGDWQVILLSPLGQRLHLSLRLALEGRLQERLGYRPQCLHHDDGVLLRLTDSDEPILDLLEGLTPENVEGLLLEELADSALFALRFRQNAARALLLPRGPSTSRARRRAPLWLQRLRGRDLLQVARQHADFPVVVETFRECLHDHLDVPHLQELLQAIREKRVQVVTRRADTPSPFASSLLFTFTAAFMYESDRVAGEGGGPQRLDRHLLEQLISPEKQEHLLDPRSIRQVERRLRGLGQPPRSATEMAEWLRRLGDLAPSELEGPMANFLEALQAQGRACTLELPEVREPLRWVSSEEELLYRRAFGFEPATPEQAREAALIIFSRFVDTHALVSLADVLERYPFDADWARRQLEEWARSRRTVAVVPNPSEPEASATVPSDPESSATDFSSLQWSAPANLDQIQRGSLALLRREVLSVPATSFADFLLRWQRVHPDSRQGASEGLGLCLERLEGLPLPAELWENAILSARVPAYQGRWLDEWISGGAGAWVCQVREGSSQRLLAFFSREMIRQLSPQGISERGGEEASDRVLEVLHHRGASFVPDLAMETGLPPSTVRRALWNLVGRSLVTNDRFEVIRRGEPAAMTSAEGDASPWRSVGLARRRAPRRQRATLERPEGRWELVPWGQPDPEEQAIVQAGLLLARYGVVARELALMDPWMASWRVLYEVFTRLELAGEVRRGYFVEGLSGAQFALPEAAEMLQDLPLPSQANAPVVLLSSLDPANLYGSGAPFDIPLLEKGTHPFPRRPGNWITLRAGRPILLIEQHGRRLTTLPSASREEVQQAIACLPGLLDQARGLGPRHKLVVEQWNGQPITRTEGRELLEGVGFVRDYQEMTLYAAWR